MDGKAVFQFAVRKVPEVIHEVLDSNGLTAEDIDWFILHQANKRIVESVAKRLKTDISRFPMNLQEYGNTSSASIPHSFKRDEPQRTHEKGPEDCYGRLWRGTFLGSRGTGVGNLIRKETITVKNKIKINKL